jgi:FAD binding domain
MMNGELHVAIDEIEFLAVFPLSKGQRSRLIGTVRADAVGEHEKLSWNDVSKTVIDRLRIHVESVNWFSTYHVHHRVADRFRNGGMFLLGDAAHIHSPVGGQGMNTGIGDAVNLSWKLAAVLKGNAEPQLLDSYEPERIAFARRLVATTDRAFTLVTSPGRIARIVRVSVAPRVLPALFRSKKVRRFMFRTISQIGINYRDSALSQGCAGHVKAGDRLPWVVFDSTAGSFRDNFAALASMDWQVHVYGDCDASLAECCNRLGLTIHIFPWHPAAARAGLQQGALYLVRPDGYVGYADPNPSASNVERYFKTHFIKRV